MFNLQHAYFTTLNFLEDNRVTFQTSIMTIGTYFFFGGNILSLLPILATIAIELSLFCFRTRLSRNFIPDEYSTFLTKNIHKCFHDDNYHTHIVYFPGKNSASNDIDMSLKRNNIKYIYVNNIILICPTFYSTIDYVPPNKCFSKFVGSVGEFNELIKFLGDLEDNKDEVKVWECNTKWSSSFYEQIGSVQANPLTPNYYANYAEIKKYIDTWKNNKEKFKKLGSSHIGFVFHGEPGTGKTQLAFSIAGYLDVPVYKMYIDDKGLHEPSNIDKKGAVLLFDDLDVLFNYDRESDEDKEEEECLMGKLINNETFKTTSKRQIFYQLLNVFDNNAKYKNCVFIVTTNYVNKFDKALFRAGRIDYKFELSKLPEENVRNIIMDWYNKSEDFDKDKLAKLELRPIVISKLMNTIKKNIDSFDGFCNATAYKVKPTDFQEI